MSSCPPGALGAAVDSGAGLRGEYKLLKGAGGGREVVAYVAGASNAGARAGIILCHDVYGVDGGRLRQVADEMAADGRYVVMAPDLFYDRDAVDKLGDRDRTAWLRQFTKERVLGDLGVVRAAIDAHVGTDSPRVGVVGFCWGAFPVFACCADGRQYDAGVSLHPSLVKVRPASDGTTAGGGCPMAHDALPVPLRLPRCSARTRWRWPRPCARRSSSCRPGTTTRRTRRAAS